MNSDRSNAVLIIVSSLGFGGAESRVVELVSNLVPRGYAITVCAVASPAAEHPLAPKIEAAGGTFASLPLRSLAGWRKLNRLLANSGVVHTHIGPAGGIVAGLAQISGTPCRIVQFHSDRPELPAGLAGRVMGLIGAGLVRRWATAIVGVSPTSLETILGRDWRLDRRSLIIAPGVDLSPFRRPVRPETLRSSLGLSGESQIIVQVGRDDPLKNRHFAVRVLAEIESDHHLVFVGGVDSTRRRELEKLAARLGVGERVHWLGARQDVPTLLGDADAMLLPSIYEGVPGVVLEAVAAGCPVVATDLPGIRDIRGLVGVEERVQVLPLAAGPRVWAKTLLKAASGPSQKQAEPWLALEGTPYDSSSTTAQVERLWGAPAPTPRRVVHLFSSLDFGGAEVRTLELLQHLADRTYEVVILQTSGEPGPLTADFEAAGARVLNVRFRSFAFIRICRTLFRDGNTQAAHVHVMRQHERPVLMLALAALWGVPVRVLHYRNEGKEPRGFIGKLVEAAYHWIGLRVATVVGGVSPASLRAALGSRWDSDKRSRLLLPGLGMDRFASSEKSDHLHNEIGVPSDVPLILVLGRDAHQKFRERAVRIFAELQSTWPEAHIVFVGATDRSLEQLVTDSEAPALRLNQIHVLHARRDVVEILRSAAVLLLTSRHEGLPGVVVESLAAGTPVVATSLPGIQFIQRDFPEDLALIEPSSPESTWALAVERLGNAVRGNTERAELHARVKRSKFSMAQVSRDYECAWGVYNNQDF